MAATLVVALPFTLTALSALGLAPADGLTVLLISRVLNGVATVLITAMQRRRSRNSRASVERQPC
ncbi:hypothetical protein [Streptomyces sp. NPDC029674]|uniref:hypothetical protein n=1 Tax=Streptomyces sp. NPDC029674 TaxID=3365297 RepID=UPI00384C5A47